MNDKDRKFLEVAFREVYGHTLRGIVVDRYLEAERILLNKERIHRRSCSCSYGSLKRSVDSLYERWLKNT